jgi:putative nucleotidyltransferase with HDIG domain
VNQDPATLHATEPARPPRGSDHAPAEHDDLQRLRADIIGHDTVPSAPAVLLEILSLLEEDDVETRRLGDAIARDGGLTARILRVANSSFFAQARTVSTVERAMFVLGVAMVRSFAVSAAVFDAIGDTLSAAATDALWHHSLAVALVARRLAARDQLGDPDQAFTAALLHDAGCMLLARRFRDFYARSGDHEKIALDVAERAALGVDHATAGGWLFEAWRLPPAIVAAVAGHHNAQASGLGALVAAADAIVCFPDPAALLADASQPRAAAVRAAMETCRLTPESWAALAAAAEQQADARGGA